MKHKTPPSLFIGRWQPFHAGHKELIERTLEEGKDVVIAIRDTELSPKDPYTPAQRRGFIRRALFPKWRDRVCIITIPDISEVVYGRNVGYGIRKVKLPRFVEAISATDIRKKT